MDYVLEKNSKIVYLKSYEKENSINHLNLLINEYIPSPIFILEK